MFPGENNSRTHHKRISYVVVGGIVLIEFLLSATWLPYGIFYAEFVKLGAASVAEALWVPIVITSTRNIFNPLTRKVCEHFNENDYNNHRQLTTVATLTTALSIILGACSRYIVIQTLTYGLFCGVTSSLISSQLKEITYEDFQSRPLLFEGLQQIAKALSLFFMPHIFYYLTLNYGVYETQFLFAALLLHIIPSSLIVYRRKCSIILNLSKYKTVPTLYNQEISVLPSTSHTENDSSSETSSDDEDPVMNITVLEAGANSETTVETVVPIYFKNCMGVDILPEIPEEDEIEEELEKAENRQKETMRDSIRRFSQLSAKFEDLISNERKSNDYLGAAADAENGVQKFNDHQFISLKQQTTAKRWFKCNCCSPYKKYLHRKRLNRITDSVFENFLKPFWSGLSSMAFYPCLLTKIGVTITSIIYVNYIPYITITIEEDNHLPHTLSAEGTMLLSLIAFPWLCFLVFLPWLINSSKNKLKTIFCLGVITLGISTFLTNLPKNYDVIAIASLLFGISYGSVELSCDIVFKEVAGIRQWQSMRNPLEVASGFFIIALYFLISASDVNLLKILGGNMVVCMLLAPFWLYNMNLCKKIKDFYHVQNIKE